jgi:hypothetical protein
MNNVPCLLTIGLASICLAAFDDGAIKQGPLAEPPFHLMPESRKQK